MNAFNSLREASLKQHTQDLCDKAQIVDTTKEPGHYQTFLNNVAYKWGYAISYEASWTGTMNNNKWTSIVYSKWQ
jgi:hypothetical protein